MNQSNAGGVPDWNSYEELAQELMRRIGEADQIKTVRLEHDVELKGLATTNQIDVLWEFVDGSGQLVRFLFECRHYGTNTKIKQQQLHSWRSIVDDVSEPNVQTVGVMVTTNGFQSGAQSVADTYGILICELRKPTKKDLANRVRTIVIEIRARIPTITDLTVGAVETFAQGASTESGQHSGALGSFVIEHDDGATESLADVLLHGEIGPIGEPPTAPHPVVRTFLPPAKLLQGSTPIARVEQISAVVGEVEAVPTAVTTEMGEVAWMLANTLNGAHLWFGEGGAIRYTSS